MRFLILFFKTEEIRLEEIIINKIFLIINHIKMNKIFILIILKTTKVLNRTINNKTNNHNNNKIIIRIKIYLTNKKRKNLNPKKKT